MDVHEYRLTRGGKCFPNDRIWRTGSGNEFVVFNKNINDIKMSVDKKTITATMSKPECISYLEQLRHPYYMRAKGFIRPTDCDNLNNNPSLNTPSTVLKFIRKL